ncbi:sulfurtransferase [Mycobacteroides abscessus]|uniref:sulfurtransferase n=1 Tax=Mycobacteroides abscessus TaxID=36809 RepID=UPI000941155F|nr:sulfurtransferase [Mycobacteroides abscessus]
MSRSDVLVDADWVQAHLDDPRVVLVEVDEDADAYTHGHIAGAVRLHWADELQDPIRRNLLSRDAFSALLSSRGIGNESTVVLYGGNNNWFAAYAYWYFKYYGHVDVRLLDGGRKKWELDGRELTADITDRGVTDYHAVEPKAEIRALRDEVLARVGEVNFLDIRTPAEFRGELLAPAHLPQEQAQRPGHIPGAINVPWSRTAREDGTFKSDAEIAQIYADAGIDWAKDTIAYCRIGERSSHSWFAIHELLGHTNIKNYDGSWTEYGSLVDVPIEMG